MTESNGWKDGFPLTGGLETNSQMDFSGLSNSQRSNRLNSPSTLKPSNLPMENGTYNSQKNLDGDTGNTTSSQMGTNSNGHHLQTQQSSQRFSSPFDLSFDDPMGGFSEYMNKQMSSESNSSSTATNASKVGASVVQRGFQSQQSSVSSQPLHVSSQSNVFPSWRAIEQYSSVGGNGEATGDAGQQRTNKIISNRFLLGTKVQPFTRDEEIVDDDLFKVFDDDLGSLTSKKLQMQAQAMSTSGAVTLPDCPPASKVSNLQQQVGSLRTQSERNQGNMVSDDQGVHGHSVRDFAKLRQQEQQEEARMQKLCRVDKSSSETAPPLQQSDAADDTFDSQFFVPSTMMPPTVLASTLPSSTNKRKLENERSQRKKSRTSSGGVSPQSKLEDLFQKAGIFGVRRVKADEAEYEVVPSALQLASFGTRVVKAVHTSDEKALSELMQCGLSPNPCNQFRDSVLDLVCKRGNVVIFECLMKHGTDLQTMDGFGRTPLHHCCWASSFCRPIVDAILERDPMQLMIEDKRGQTPLEYVRADLASDWIQYLESNLNKYWGRTVPTLSSPKAQRPSGTLPDPPNAMPVNLAAMVSSGKLLPAQVIPMIRSRKTKSN